MALTPEDSKVVAKAIQDAMSSAMKSMRADRTSEGGTPRTQRDTAAKVKKPTGGKDKVILAASASLKTLEDRADDAGDALKVMTKTVDRSNASLGVFRTGVQKAAVSLRVTRSDIGKIDFSKVADDVSKAITDSIAAGKIETKQPSAGPIVAKFGNLVKNGVNPKLESLTSSLGRFNNVVRGGIGVMVDVVKELREIGVLKKKGKKNVVDLNPPNPPKDRTDSHTDEKTRRTSDQKEADDLEAKDLARRKKARERSEELAKPPKNMFEVFEKEFKARGAKAGHDEEKVDEAFGKATKVLGTLNSMLVSLMRNGVQMVDEMFQTLAARGYGTTDSYVGLSKAAWDAGMSLREYAQFMDQNMIAISRASSFTAFQANLKSGTDALAKFGVFGEDATRLAGTMMSASTALGVPQAQMGDAIKGQLGVFEKLRKTTNITANEFAELTKQLGEDAQVRTELSALAPNEALQRQTAILDQMSYARSLNLSTSEVNKYTAAILAQRKTTVKQRFQQAGRLQQVSGLLGMGGGKADELRQLSMNKYKTGDEQKRYMDLLGEVNTGLEQMQQSGGPGSQYQSDTMREMLDQAGMGQDLEAASAIKAGKQSGDFANKDMGKQLSSIDQKLGTMMAWLDGFTKGPIGQAIVSMVGGIGTLIATFTAGAGLLGTVIGTAAGRVMALMTMKGTGGFAGLFERTGPAAESAASGGKWGKVTGALGKAASGLGKAMPYIAAVAGTVTAISDYSNAEEAAKPESGGDGDVGKKKGEAVGEGIGSVAGTIIGSALGSFVPVIGTAIGASVGGLLGGFAGKLIGGWANAETAQEKNTKAIEASTKVATAAIKKGMPTDTVMVDALNQLDSNLIQSARASRTATVGEVQRAQDDSKSRAQLMTDLAPQTKAFRDAASPDEIKKAHEQALASVTASTPEGKKVDQKAVDAQAEQTLKDQAFDKMMKERRKAQDGNDQYLSTDGTRVSAGNTGIKGPDTSPVVAAASAANGLGSTPATVKAPGDRSVWSYIAAGEGVAGYNTRNDPKPGVTQASMSNVGIATPASPTPKIVGPAAVNTGEKDAKEEADRKAAAAKAVTATLGAPGAQDPGDVLKQILDILKQSLIAENQQVDLTDKLLRNQVTLPSQPDKAATFQNTARQ
jgi:hypothetical protein